jgi:hypothetical protein
MVVRVNRPAEAFVGTTPHEDDGIRRSQKRRQKRFSATAPGDKAAAAADAAVDGATPAVEVLMVMEVKRNPDDVARGFHQQQRMLRWLAAGAAGEPGEAGKEEEGRGAGAGVGTVCSYDPAEWRNCWHPTGHFMRGYHAMPAAPGPDHVGTGGGGCIVMTRDSFRRFRRDDASGFYMEGCW